MNENRFLRSEAHALLQKEHGDGSYGALDYITTMLRKSREVGDDVAVALWSRLKFRATSHQRPKPKTIYVRSNRKMKDSWTCPHDGRKNALGDVACGECLRERPRFKCEAVGGPHLMPGWACCRCNVYNGEQRTACKNCHHEKCFGR